MSDFKLDPKQRRDAGRLHADMVEYSDDLEEYAYELVWSRAEIARLQAVLDAALGVIEEIRSAAKAGRLPAGTVQRMVNEALERYDYLMDGEVKP